MPSPTEVDRPSEGSQDRRALRTRAAVHAAAIALVAERGTTDIALAEIATAADVSRQAIYLHYRDRDDVLIGAAFDLFTTRLLPTADRPADQLAHLDIDALADHFHTHRAFYRAMMDGPCGYPLNRRLFQVLQPFNRSTVRLLIGETLPEQVVDDISAVLTGGTEKLVVEWVTSPNPDDPATFASRVTTAVLTMFRAAAPPTP